MQPSPAHPIEAQGLVKRYGDLTAVDGIDLHARRGTCVGLLGPNGAGKTTTIEILEGLNNPDAGEALILGMSWKDSAFEIRERIGVQLQDTRLQDKLTVRETLRLFRSFYKTGREVAEVLDLVGLADKTNDRVVNLSGGQQQRLALGCSLVNDPELLFLDEPTTGLDPQARRRVWEIVEDIKEKGRTVLLTTHYMDEAERLADELYIMDGGRMIAEGSPASIIRTLDAESIVEFTLPPTQENGRGAIDQDALDALPGVTDVRILNNVITLSVTDTQACLSSLFDWLKTSELVAEDVRTHRPTLEDVFVSLTGKHLRDG